MCQTCCNLALKIEALNRYAEKTNNDSLKMKLKGANNDTLADLTLCDYSSNGKYPKNDCLNRKMQQM